MATIEAWMAWEAMREAKHATQDGLKALGDALLGAGNAAVAAGAPGVAASLFDAATGSYQAAIDLAETPDPEPPESLEPSDEALVPTGDDDDVAVASNTPSTDTGGGSGSSGSDPQPGPPPDDPGPPGGEAGLPADDGGGDRDGAGRVGGSLSDSAKFFADAFGLLGAVTASPARLPAGGDVPARPHGGATDPNPDVSAAAARRLGRRAAVVSRSVGFTDPSPDLIDLDHAALRDTALRLRSQQAQIARAVRALASGRATRIRPG